MAFYLLTWTYFNDVIEGKNIYSIPNLKEYFLLVARRKNETKLRKTGNNTDKSDFSENEMLDLNSLKTFEFETKTNIGDINIVAVIMRKKVLNIKYNG